MSAGRLRNAGGPAKRTVKLLSLAEAEFDVLLTLDKNLPYQQDLKSGRIALLIIRALSNRIQDLLPVVPDCLVALQSIQPGQVVRVGNRPTC
jgi:hypothetical protein